MDKAQQVVSDFMSHDGEHKTVVDQDYRAAITEEHVRPSRHEEITTAIDKEIHQDHHHTTIQPIKAAETLPETHTHNSIPIENKAFEHDNANDVRATLDADAAKYRDSTMTHETTHTSVNAPVITGEHVHHHLHEHIQPVVYKDTIAPEVVHTTVPIHETHHAPTVHHTTTTLPSKTWEEFERDNGVFSGRETRTVTEYNGCAQPGVEGVQGEPVDSAMVDVNQNTAANATGNEVATGEVDPMTPSGAAEESTSPNDPVAETAARNAMSDDYQMSSQNDPNAYNDAAIPRSSERTALRKSLRSSQSGASNTSRTSKVSLKDKLNPFKDADGDGKKGIMS